MVKQIDLSPSNIRNFKLRIKLKYGTNPTLEGKTPLNKQILRYENKI